MSNPAAQRRYYARHYQSDHARTGRATIVPDDVERFEGDGSPCFNCEARGGCKHRPWMLVR